MHTQKFNDVNNPDWSIFEDYPTKELDQIDYSNFTEDELRSVKSERDGLIITKEHKISFEDIDFVMSEIFCWILRNPTNAINYAQYGQAISAAMRNVMVKKWKMFRE